MITELQTTCIQSPIGTLEITVSNKGIRRIRSVQEGVDETIVDPSLQEYIDRLAAYFDGSSQDFENLPMEMIGSAFQLDVWNMLLEIPFGYTVTYKELAEAIGKPDASRAVGNALNANPLLIVVPCHRVLPTGGDREKCGGFAAGEEAKQWLLEYEKA